MRKQKRTIGVIPARGGSKRIIRKNIRHLNGKPLLAWTIQAAREAEILENFLVSTEDAEIGEIAKAWGAPEIVKRSESLANDDSLTNDVLLEVLLEIGERGQEYDYVALLQPTSPLRTGVQIDEAFSLMNAKNANGVISVCRTEHPTEWMGKMSPDGLMDTFIETTQLTQPSSKLPPSYQINGAIYIVSVEKFLEQKTLFLKSGIAAYVMDRASSVDIDNDYDFELASWLLKGVENVSHG